MLICSSFSSSKVRHAKISWTRSCSFFWRVLRRSLSWEISFSYAWLFESSSSLRETRVFSRLNSSSLFLDSRSFLRVRFRLSRIQPSFIFH